MEELERLRAEFLAMVSHELPAPLTSIKGSAAAVLGTSSVLDAAEMQQFFRIIDGQADHMLDLISDLLVQLTTIEYGLLYELSTNAGHVLTTSRFFSVYGAERGQATRGSYALT